MKQIDWAKMPEKMLRLEAQELALYRLSGIPGEGNKAMARWQPYFDEGLEVYRAAIGADYKLPSAKQKPRPERYCVADSKRKAQRIAAALNGHVPRNERNAIQREILAKMPRPRLDLVKAAFKRRDQNNT